jgi:hypothetical protein
LFWRQELGQPFLESRILSIFEVKLSGFHSFSLLWNQWKKIELQMKIMAIAYINYANGKRA